MISSPSKYEAPEPSAPVYFVDPATGEYLEFDLNTATFKTKERK